MPHSTASSRSIIGAGPISGAAHPHMPGRRCPATSALVAPRAQQAARRQQITVDKSHDPSWMSPTSHSRSAVCNSLISWTLICSVLFVARAVPSIAIPLAPIPFISTHDVGSIIIQFLPIPQVTFKFGMDNERRCSNDGRICSRSVGK
jgi:hypothetical protein